MLPCKCVFCDLRQSPEINGEFSLVCDECGARQSCCPKYACGDPRNLGLFGHWDGWTPFGKCGKHCCGMFNESSIFLNEY